MNKKIFIELRGMGFVNKGAELMLVSILKELREKYGDRVQICKQYNLREPFAPFRKYNITPIISAQKFRISTLYGLLPKFLRDLFKAKSINDKMHFVIDGSGFALGDQWPHGYVYRRFNKHLDRWKKNGSKLILMPQAFGPFTKDDIRKLAIDTFDYAELIFARDPISYDYVTAISERNVTLAPDFTNLAEAKDYKQQLDILIIPNKKMIDKANDGGAYFSFLKESINLFVKKGRNVTFLIHEGLDDYQIAKEVCGAFKFPIEILQEADPLLVKGIIKNSKIVVTSRFHGLVSSLSQGIPTLATSWSHKYQMLLNDYHYSEGMVDINDLSELNKKVEMLTDLENYKRIENNLLKYSEIEKNRSKHTWDMVFNVINKKK